MSPRPARDGGISPPVKKIFGLIGYPVKHSLSPLMHNAAFKELGIPAEYKLFEIAPQELESFFKNLTRKNIFGLNVTVPYKERVLPFLDEISSDARSIGAVNTVINDANRLSGFNTDGVGFLRHLSEDLHFSIAGRKIALIGAGGAAKAAAVYLSKNKPERISIYDLDKVKSSVLISQLKKNFPGVEFFLAERTADLRIDSCDLLINATPIGMKEADPEIIDANLLRKGLLVYDLIYNPAQTKILRRAKEIGASTANGLGMLLYQGAASFEIWTGRKAPLEVMREALNQGVKNL
ncbi:MAG: shikimate dehydrogenase [Candidatus Omnitrophota bacterium]